MNDEVPALWGFMKVTVHDFEAAEANGEKAVEDIIMVSPKVKDIRFVFLDFLKNKPNKAGVSSVPSTASTEGPTVDDISVEDEVFAGGVLEEVVDFIDLAIGSTEVYIGEENRFKVKDGLGGLFHCCGCRSVEMSCRYESTMESHESGRTLLRAALPIFFHACRLLASQSARARKALSSLNGARRPLVPCSIRRCGAA